MIRWKRELAIFVAIFLFLALGMHFKEWMDHPVAHIEALPQSPLGPWHPLYIALGAYVLVLIVRLAVGGLRRLFKTKD